MNKKIILTLTVLCSYGLVQADPFTVVRRANRRFNAELVRNGAADRCVRQDLAAQPTNGDEERYEDLRGSYSKGLKQIPVTPNGSLVDPEAYESLVFALATGNPSDFNKILMGTPDNLSMRRLLHSPQAGFDFNLGGADSWIHSIAAPPALASGEKASEIIELYWMALMRGANFLDLGAHSNFGTATTELAALPDFKGPKVAGAIDATTLFRSTVPGATKGWYISQFLWQPVTFSDSVFDQLYTFPQEISGNDFVKTFPEWTNIQAGNPPTGVITWEANKLFIKTPRQLASFVHNDPPQLPYIFALLILNKWAAADPNILNPNNPYKGNLTQTQFAEFFVPQFIGLLSQACDMALRAAWYQKWLVHRTIRPEVYAFLVQRQRADSVNMDLHASINTSAGANANFTANGNYLLPQAFPEGSPLHPTYPAGHATIGGAAVTILKAFFNGDADVPNPMQPDVAGTALVPYAGPDAPLKIEHELNKLAANIAHGRNMAGVHFRSDAEASLRLGEAVALSLLEDFAYTMNIDFKGFTLTKFDGTQITVGAKKVMPGLPK